MRLIDADELLTDPYFMDETIPERGMFIEAVEDSMTIDAVPVVRCKDCKHRVERGMCYMISGCPELVGVGDNFWCAYGKRKDGDGNG